MRHFTGKEIYRTKNQIPSPFFQIIKINAGEIRERKKSVITKELGKNDIENNR